MWRRDFITFDLGDATVSLTRANWLAPIPAKAESRRKRRLSRHRLYELGEASGGKAPGTDV